MFEVPGAKRIRRSELLQGSSPSRSPSPDTADARDSIRFDFEYVDRSHERSRSETRGAQESNKKPKNEALEFRLFSSKKAPQPDRAADSSENADRGADVYTTATTRQPGIHRINFRSPTPLAEAGDGSFVVPYRAQSYYFTSSTDPKRREEYAETAVAGTEVLSRAQRTKWPGTALPWRVIHLPSSDSKSPSAITITISAGDGETSKHRTRAGKKKRITLRKKHKDAVLKAETEKEKRTRRNREKKVKKKAKEKLKKLEGMKGEDEDAGVGGDVA